MTSPKHPLRRCLVELGLFWADLSDMKLVARRQMTVFSIAVMAFGLLLWARFILVTGHPRTATAVPLPAHASAEATNRVSPAQRPVAQPTRPEPVVADGLPIEER